MAPHAGGAGVVGEKRLGVRVSDIHSAGEAQTNELDDGALVTRRLEKKKEGRRERKRPDRAGERKRGGKGSFWRIVWGV